MLKVSLHVGNENYCIIYGTMRNMNFNFIPNFIPTNRCLDFLYIFFLFFYCIICQCPILFYQLKSMQCKCKLENTFAPNCSVDII